MNKAIGASILEGTLRRDRMVVVAGLLLVVSLCWAYLLAGAGTMREMGGMLMPMSSGPWTPGYALLMLAMWIVMMVAMMLPSAAPTILLYATIARNRHAHGGSIRHAADCGIFVLGYVAVWSLFSLVAVALQFGMEQAALLSPMMRMTSGALAGAVLIGAGIYQWTPVKRTCLRRCSSPLEFVLTYWREGRRGAFAMGARHGVYCVGCCWMLMLLLFVGGLMNLAWIAGLAVYVLLEKFAPAGHWVGRAAGTLLIGWGAAILFALA
jgi:predicted metal-binding membrane protein